MQGEIIHTVSELESETPSKVYNAREKAEGTLVL